MDAWRQIFRTKDIQHDSQELARCLSAVDLTLLGIGVIIGAGIFVLTGIAAAKAAGPAIILSFALSGIACAFSSLCYAEMATCIGGCGSAYGYVYAGLGEIVAWIIGWDLLLEYGMGASTVAIGWSSYFNDFLISFNIHLPKALNNAPAAGGLINLPAVCIMLFVTFMCAIGPKKSAKLNKLIVIIKLAIIALFMIIAAPHFNPTNWHPFLPFGWKGVVQGASMVFFAYIGFDAVSTAAEETINPQRNLPIGIITSLLICTAIYMIFSALLTGATSYTLLNVSSPVASVLEKLGYHVAAALIAVGAIAGLTSCILVLFYGLSRIILAMCRDQLLPAGLAQIHSKTLTPLVLIVWLGFILTTLAGFLPINIIASLVNIGTLSAFTLVCLGVLVLRKTKPDLIRTFKTPGMPWVPILGAGICLFLMFSLPRLTWINFIIWNILGVIIYFCYGRQHSKLNYTIQSR